eukprot:358768-Chlamydomonas_euryale.AAC.3
MAERRLRYMRKWRAEMVPSLSCWNIWNTLALNRQAVPGPSSSRQRVATCAHAGCAWGRQR